MKPKQKIIEYKHTDKMSLKEWKQFAKNYRNEGLSIKQFLIIHENIRFAGFISYAFTWCFTKQGHDYWYKISKR